MDNKKVENKELSIKEWIICLGGILILLLFIALPPIFRIAFAEEEPFSPIPTMDPSANPEVTPHPDYADIDETKYERVVCKVSGINNLGYPEETEVTFGYEDNKLKVHVAKSVVTFDINNQDQKNRFEIEKANCNKTYEVFGIIRGYKRYCSYTSNSLIVIQKFNLARFSNTAVSDIDGNPVLISPGYTFNEDVTSIKTTLEGKKYTCETKKASIE